MEDYAILRISFHYDFNLHYLPMKFPKSHLSLDHFFRRFAAVLKKTTNYFHEMKWHVHIP